MCICSCSACSLICVYPILLSLPSSFVLAGTWSCWLLVVHTHSCSACSLICVYLLSLLLPPSFTLASTWSCWLLVVHTRSHSASPFIYAYLLLLLLAPCSPSSVLSCVHPSSLWLAPICVCPLSPLLAPSFTITSPFSHALGCMHPLVFLFACASPQVQVCLPLLSPLCCLHWLSPLLTHSCMC